MPYFSHPICDDCWVKLHEGRRYPVRITEREWEKCCVCGEATDSGIYVRGRENEYPHCECGQ